MERYLGLLDGRKVTLLYRAIHSVSCKVLKMVIWEVAPADWLTLQLPTAQADTRNSCGKT